jgi:hypothetical protein
MKMSWPRASLAGELVPLTIDAKVPMRPQMLAQLGARVKQKAKDRPGP